MAVWRAEHGGAFSGVMVGVVVGVVCLGSAVSGAKWMGVVRRKRANEREKTEARQMAGRPSPQHLGCSC